MLKFLRYLFCFIYYINKDKYIFRFIASKNCKLLNENGNVHD